MKVRLYPGERIASVYTISYQKLWDQGIRGILYDIDNTLVPDNAPADSHSEALFHQLHAIGFRTCLVSNNKEPRVLPFAEAVQSEAVCRAHKPAAAGYLEGVRRMGIHPEQALFIGDQIFTDIWGANNAGIRNFLVRPVDPHERFRIRLKRIPEGLILFLYELSRKIGRNRKK